MLISFAVYPGNSGNQWRFEAKERQKSRLHLGGRAGKGHACLEAGRAVTRL